MKYAFPLIIIAVISLTSCNKDPFSLPSEVNFHFGMIKVGVDDVNTYSSSPRNYIINGGYLSVNSLAFEGRRENAADFFFNSVFSPVLEADLGEGYANQAVKFDIPQGIYERIEWIFNLGGENQIPLILFGEVHLNNHGKKYSLQIEYDLKETVRVVAVQPGKNQIILNQNVPAVVKVEVDAEYLLRLVNQGMILNAETTIVDGEKIILINSQNNRNIFDKIASRINQSFTVTFQ
jgi:hypothetical protein